MPYVYNAAKAARGLTVQFQGYDIPQSVMADFFIALTKLIDKIFLAHKANDREVREILEDISLHNEDKTKQLNEALPEALLIMQLRQGNVASFKKVISKENISDAEMEKYVELMKDMVFYHIFHLICELNTSIAATKTITMWNHSSSNSSSSKTIKPIEEREKTPTHTISPTHG